MGRGSSHSEANASKALQVPGEASHAGVFHPQASELSHLLPAPRGAAAAGRAHSELDTRGKAAALRRRTALRGTCPPPGTGTGPGPQARQGLSRTPSPGAGYAARSFPTRTAVKGRTGPHLLLPAPRSAESKRTSPRPPHTGDTPATDTHPSPPGSQAEEERRRSASRSAPGPFPYPGAPGPPSAATAISPRPRHDAARPPPPYPLPHAEDTHPPRRRREGASRRRRHLRLRGDRACAARPPTFPGWRGAAVRVNRRSPAAGGAGRE